MKKSVPNYYVNKKNFKIIPSLLLVLLLVVFLIGCDEDDTSFNYVDNQTTVLTDVDQTVISVGDIDELNEAFALFNSEVLNAELLTNISTTITTTTIGNQSAEAHTFIGSEYDFNDFYFRTYFTDNRGETDTVMLVPYENKLVEFTSNGHLLEYEVYSDTITEQVFNSYLLDVEIDEGTYTDGMVSIDMRNEFTYDILLDKTFLSATEDMNDVLEKQGIEGLNEASITAVISFDSDYKEFSMYVTVTGLYLAEDDDITITIEIVNTASCNGFIKKNPLDLANRIVLPKSKEDILIVTTQDFSHSFYTNDTDSSWARMDLEAGYYIARIHADSFTVYDSEGNKVDNDYYLIIEESGTYYFDIYSNRPEDISFCVFKVPDRNLVVFDLDTFQGNMTFEMDGSLIDFEINIPVGTTDRLVRFDLPEDEEFGSMFGFHADEFLNGATFGKTYEGYEMSVYFYIPANESLTISAGGEFVGSLVVDYEIFDIPTFTGLMPVQDSDSYLNIPDVVLTEEILESRFNFTIAETGEYNVVFEYFNMGMAQIQASLYTSDGTLISQECNHRWRELEPGDYYVVYRFDGEFKNIVIIITDIYRDE